MGDCVQIDIPGPGPASGEGYDWVRIEALEDNSPASDEESCGMRVRSCKDPNINSDDTAHVFTSDATSTFLIGKTEYGFIFISWAQ